MRTKILQDHLGAQSLKETLNFETQGFKGEDEMDNMKWQQLQHASQKWGAQVCTQGGLQRQHSVRHWHSSW